MPLPSKDADDKGQLLDDKGQLLDEIMSQVSPPCRPLLAAALEGLARAVRLAALEQARSEGL